MLVLPAALSKLVHGGFRYLQNAQFQTTLELVRERERLLKEGRGLVNPLGFILPCYEKDKPPAWVFGFGLIIYDLLAAKWGHRYYDFSDLLELCPILKSQGLLGGFRFFDCQVDDARLVLRVIFEAINDGGLAVNYANVIQLINNQSGKVCGAVIEDTSNQDHLPTKEIYAKVIINATGAWVDQLRKLNTNYKEISARQLRKLRGSHLVFSSERIPLTRAVCTMHPKDHRFIYIFPWEGNTILGTTDIDHLELLKNDIRISDGEIDYLIEAVQNIFPGLEIEFKDIQATYSGIRPVIGTGKEDPSKKSRDHVIWYENGLLTVTGGKLTTFRVMAHTALKTISSLLPSHPKLDPGFRVLDEIPQEDFFSSQLSRQSKLRIAGKYGAQAMEVIQYASSNELSNIGTLPSLWAELRWAAHAEGVVHLDDLLLRRVRIGMVNPSAVEANIDQICKIIKDECQWDENRFNVEIQNYREIIQNYYLP